MRWHTYVREISYGRVGATCPAPMSRAPLSRRNSTRHVWHDTWHMATCVHIVMLLPDDPGHNLDRHILRSNYERCVECTTTTHFFLDAVCTTPSVAHRGARAAARFPVVISFSWPTPGLHRSARSRLPRCVLRRHPGSPGGVDHTLPPVHRAVCAHGPFSLSSPLRYACTCVPHPTPARARLRSSAICSQCTRTAWSQHPPSQLSLGSLHECMKIRWWPKSVRTATHGRRRCVQRDGRARNDGASVARGRRLPGP